MVKFFSRKATQYIFFELFPPFVLGLIVFIFILLMFQALRLTDFVLVHGVGVGVIGKIVMYLSISFLPALFPMSLLFAVIITYGRFSVDSEITAFKSVGINMGAILVPALILSLLVSIVSAQTSFHLAPWGNRQFELLITKIGQAKAGISLKEGTFSEGFFDLVIYANNVNSQNNKLEKVFIYDERSGDTPLTIIAKHGQIIQDPNSLGNSALLRLENGDIHRKTETHTKIKFDSFDIRLFDDVQEQRREKTPLSMTIEEIAAMAADSKQPPEVIRSYQTEFHKRWALAVICPIFALLGVGLSTQANRRQKSNGLILSLGLVLGYWILYVAMEGFARGGQLPVALAVWLPNILYTISGLFVLRKNWN